MVRREKKKGWKVSFSPSYFHGWEEEEEGKKCCLSALPSFVRSLTDEREDEHERGKGKKYGRGKKCVGWDFRPSIARSGEPPSFEGGGREEIDVGCFLRAWRGEGRERVKTNKREGGGIE